MENNNNDRPLRKKVADAFTRLVNPAKAEQKRQHLTEFRMRGLTPVDDATRELAKTAIKDHNRSNYDPITESYREPKLPNASKGIIVTHWDGQESQTGRLLTLSDGRTLHQKADFEYQVIPSHLIDRKSNDVGFTLSELGREQERSSVKEALRGTTYQAGPPPGEASSSRQQQIRSTTSAPDLRSQRGAQRESSQLAYEALVHNPPQIPDATVQRAAKIQQQFDEKQGESSRPPGIDAAAARRANLELAKQQVEGRRRTQSERGQGNSR
jgi:hypothetical protein